MTSAHYSGLGATEQGRTQQLNHAYKGIVNDLARRKVITDPDCERPTNLPNALRLIESLKLLLTDAQTVIDAMRAAANSDAPPTVSTTQYWDSKRMARESGVAVCTICRNAVALGGVKLGGDWLFPAGTTYGKKRRRKAK